MAGMRSEWRAALAAAGLALALAPLSATGAAAQDLIPAKRFVVSGDTDLPGGDIASMLDTTQEACVAACTASARCEAFTFNANAGACFLKADPGAPADFTGAISGVAALAPAGAEARAKARAGELTFLGHDDIAAATAQAAGLGSFHLTGPYSAEEHLGEAARQEAQGDPLRASDFVGAALSREDTPANWESYARLLIAGAAGRTDDRDAVLARALAAAVNGTLRADAPALRHTLLSDMGQALEQSGRGADAVNAYRMAQSLQPRDDTAALLDAAAAKYGFRVTDNDVQSDSARPRICATFSADLQPAGTDWQRFVQLPDAGLTVEKSGTRQLCVEGVAFGTRYALTFRAGIPAADGQATLKPVTITAYVRDRAPVVRFPGRAFVMPAAPGAALPVETVNTPSLDLTLYAVPDRNLMRAIQSDDFGQPIPYWNEESFAGEVGAQIWSGTAEVGHEVNRDTTTRLPLDEALRGRAAGIYALKAAVPGKEESDVPPAWQWFVVSDLGITSLSGVDGLHVVVRSLASAAAKAGAEVQLLSRTNAVLGTATADDQGHAVFAAALAQGRGGMAPGMVVVRDGDADLAFLPLTDPEFDLSDRGVAGREAAGPVDVFVATDRGAYRAGETVHATALARDPQARAVEGLPLTAIVRRPDGVEYSRAVAQDEGAGGHVFDLPIAGSAPRGMWRLDVLADLDAPPLRSATFLVEDFLPERIDVTLALPDGPVRLGDVPGLAVEARYLFGSPGADLAVEGEVVLREATSLARYPGYVFGRADEPFSAQVRSFDAARTGADGRATIPVALPDVTDPARPLEVEVHARVSEGSGRPVERSVTRALTPASPVLGIKPLFDGVVGENADAAFDLVAVGPDEAPAAMKVNWVLTRIQTDYQWYQEYGNWNWQPVTTRTPVAQGTADLGGPDPAKVSGAVTWGEYELAVEQADGGAAAASTTFYAGWYVSADVSSTPDTLEMSLDRADYAPGQTAMLRVVPRAAGTALVMVLSDRLVALKVVPLAAGENAVPLEVTKDWGAGAYVTVSALRPMDVAAGRNPARAMGLAYAAIDPGDRALEAQVQVADEVAPRGPMDVAVKVAGLAPGETGYATIAAVDVGILNLTGYEAPDPNGYYFGQRRLGVGIRDLYGRLIDGMNGAVGAVRSGGDAGAQARLDAPPPTEELVAYFAGPVTVGADGLAHATFDLPSFNGTVRVMAVVWSKSGVGEAARDVLVRDPVVVTASVPRFIAPGDTSRLLLEVVHAKGPAGRMGLDVTAQGLTLGAVPSGFDLAQGGKAVLEVPVTAGAAGLGGIDVTLTTPDGTRLAKHLALPVEANDPEVAHITRQELAPGATFTLDADALAGLVPGSGRATLAVGPIARLDAPGLLQALDAYPYGCTEQITSKALPLIYYDQVARAMRLKGADDIGLRIRQAVDEVLLNQDSGGAFGLWQAGSGDFWLDAYVTDFLSRARAQGYAVPDLAFRAALDNLRNQVNAQADFDTGGEALAYALMVLAREGAAAIGDLRYYADVKGDAFATPMAQAQVGAALASYGDQPRADAMFRRAGAAVMAQSQAPKAQVWRADYGTARRDAAAVLALATQAGSKVLDEEGILSRLATRPPHLSTQEMLWTLLATSALIDRPGADGLTVDGAVLAGPLVQVLDRDTPASVIRNGGARPATLTLTTFGVPEVPEPAGGNGYALARGYFTMDGTPVDLAQGVAPGTRLVAVLDVTPFSDVEARLVVDDPLPAGFEIDNPNLLAGGDVGGLGWLAARNDVTHTEFRQDRFVSAVDQTDAQPFRLAYVVRAVSPGRFHHPAAMVMDMYRPEFRAQTDAGEVTVGQ